MATEETRLSGYEPPPGAGEGCLVVIHAPSRRLLGARLVLRAAEATLGRDAACDLVLDAEDVSRRHARVRAEEGSHLLEDLGSTNGTFVGEARVSRLALRPGHLVRLGSVVLKYLAGDDLEALYHAEVKRLAEEDPLTGLANRGAFADALAREVARARRHGNPLSLAMLDVDRFKDVNDRHGHPAGDAVLRALAAGIRPLVRAEQLLARVGGEELALLLPDVGLPGARAFAEKVRRQVAERPVLHEGVAIAVTVSVGVAELTPSDEGPERLLARADEHLYQAKRAGRDRVAG
jgi:two-component system cell cycle response regulator